MNIKLYFHTLIHLKLKQVCYQVYYRIKKSIRKNYPLSVSREGKKLNLVQAISKPAGIRGKQCLFLNLSYPFQGDWNDLSNGKLWTYNLNYMDFLLQSDMSYETGAAWIDHFIRNLSCHSIGMEAYPISLRSVNWIKFITLHPAKISPVQKQCWDASLYAQYQHLRQNVEYHLLGNHVLENGFSLLWGAFYFSDNKLYRTALKILTRELKRQILPDGGHVERSPMYHCILLDRLLDGINLVQHNNCFCSQSVLSSLFAEKAEAMLAWLNTIIHPDGNIPLLNDSAHGIAPSVRLLNEYANRLNLALGKTVPLKQSGLRKLVSSSLELIADFGSVGPDYQPGHAHADTFSFELYVHGRPVIVDTGTSTYEINAIRFYERSTAAHNTVVVNDRNSSEVWSGHRVARRAKVKITQDSPDCLEAGHSGYHPSHIRKIKKTTEGIHIEDLIEGKGKAYFHFHPDEILTVEQYTLTGAGYQIIFSGAIAIETVKSWYAPEFNKRIPNPCFRVTFENRLSATIKPLPTV